MKIRFVYKEGQDDAPGMEVLKSMRDLFVQETRTALLSGLFRENPEDLDVYGEVLTNRIKLVVIKSSSKDRLEKELSWGDVFGGVGTPAGDSGGEHQAIGEEHASTPKVIGPGDIVDDNPFVARVAMSNRVSESEFRGESDMDALRVDVRERVRGISRDFVKEFLRVKASKKQGL